MLITRPITIAVFTRTAWMGMVVVGLSCIGCAPAGPSRQAVRGTVTLDGKPAAGLSLVFTPTGGEQVGAAVHVVEGQFSLDAIHGPSVGQYDVTFDTIEPDLEEFEQLRQAGKKPFSTIQLHPRYRNPGGHQVEVVPNGANVFKFELRSY